MERRDLAIDFIFSLVLIEVLKQVWSSYLLTNKLWKLSITPNYKIHVSISIFSSLIKKKRNNPACLFTAVSLACVGAMLFSVHIAFILPSLWRLNISLKC